MHIFDSHGCLKGNLSISMEIIYAPEQKHIYGTVVPAKSEKVTVKVYK